MERLKIWWEASRAFSFTAAVVPVLLGSTLALHDGKFSLALLLWTLAGSVLIQAGTNMTNDYYDHRRRVDRLDEDGMSLAGPSMVIQRGLLPEESVRRAGLVCFFLGAVIGVYLAFQSSLLILLLGPVSVLAGFYYTGGGRPLAYRALGELTVFFFMGPVIVLGAYVVQTGTVALAPLLASIPVGLLVTAILHANNLRDLNRDKARGKTTLASLVGPTGAAVELLILVGGAYFSVAMLVNHQILAPMCALVFLSFVDAVKIIRVGFQGPNSPEANDNVMRTAQLHAKFGLMLVMGVLLSCFF